MSMILKPQEIPFDHADSCNYFRPSPNKPFLATPGALSLFGIETIADCLRELQLKAAQHHGLDYLQVFTDPESPEALWFIEDGEGGAITALLPSEH